MTDGMGQRLRTRAMIVMGSLSVTLVCGGWFLTRVFTHHGRHDPADVGAQVFSDVLEHVADDYVDSMSDPQIYNKATEGMVAELRDGRSTYLNADRLAKLTDSAHIAGPHASRRVQRAVLLHPSVGYVLAGVFSDSTARTLRHAVDSLHTAGARTVILDFRNDTGGTLAQGVAVSSLFLTRKQSVVSVRGRATSGNRQYASESNSLWPALRVILLINGGTAIAPELVAGALQDHDRALLVGSTSFGLASTQTTFPVDSGAELHLTTGLWYTPSGRRINQLIPRDADDEDDDGEDSTMVDSLGVHHEKRPTFHTDGGRTVLGGGGIAPDVAVEDTARFALDNDKDFHRMLETDTVLLTAEKLADRATTIHDLVFQH